MLCFYEFFHMVVEYNLKLCLSQRKNRNCVLPFYLAQDSVVLEEDPGPVS